MAFNPKKHKRRSIRLKGYNYAAEGLYFVTLCCQNRVSYFGSIRNGEMHLNELGKIVAEEWTKTESIRDNIKLHEFIIMPNHMHGIIEILFQKGDEKLAGQKALFKSPSQTIGAIIRGYKGATTKRIKILLAKAAKERSTGELPFAPTMGELPFAPTGRSLSIGKIWQRNYYERIIRNQKAYENISNYIINNPARWGKDKFNSSIRKSINP